LLVHAVSVVRWPIGEEILCFEPPVEPSAIFTALFDLSDEQTKVRVIEKGLRTFIRFVQRASDKHSGRLLIIAGAVPGRILSRGLK
jgi:hypothetical protein